MFSPYYGSNIVSWCNGNTTEFGSVIWGSNPYGTTFACDSTFPTGQYKREGISRLGRNRRGYVPDPTGGNRVIGSRRNHIPYDSEVLL